VDVVRLSDNEAKTVLDLLMHPESNDRETQTSLMEKIRDRLQNQSTKTDLIDVMANILNTRKAKNVLTGAVLESLEEAILSPRETARLEALASTNIGCASCGISLQLCEMTTIGGQNVYCTLCSIPSRIRCSTCRQLHDAPRGVGDSMLKTSKECGHKGAVDYAPMDYELLRMSEIAARRPAGAVISNLIDSFSWDEEGIDDTPGTER